MKSALQDFGGALSLLTIIPAPRALWVGEGWQAGRALIWFPGVGWIVGTLLYAVFMLTMRAFSPLLVAALTLAAWEVLTGGLHLDGLIDSCDALCATVSPERRLEIMKDPRAGSFGVIGAGLILILKVSALASLRDPAAVWLIPVYARTLMLLPIMTYPSARSTGMGSAYRQGASRVWLAAVGLLPALLLRPMSAAWLVLGALVALLAARWAASRLGGGLTGDVYGAICELVETVCLISATL